MKSYQLVISYDRASESHVLWIEIRDWISLFMIPEIKVGSSMWEISSRVINSLCNVDEYVLVISKDFS